MASKACSSSTFERRSVHVRRSLSICGGFEAQVHRIFGIYEARARWKKSKASKAPKRPRRNLVLDIEREREREPERERGSIVLDIYTYTVKYVYGNIYGHM